MSKAAGPLDPYEFGAVLLDSNDLDPIYVALWGAQLPREALLKWLLAYWSFYHAGTSSWVVDQGDYWGAMLQAAGSKDYPRGRERRHFRGTQALESVAWLRAKGLESLFHPLLRQTPVPASDTICAVQRWLRFGPWISFKVADMLERLGLCPVVFGVGDMDLYDSPRAGAAALAELEGVVPRAGQLVPWAVCRLLGKLEGRLAPPRYERTLNVQEAETILCKWHGALSGHYRLGEDIIGLRWALDTFSGCPTAAALSVGARRGGLW